jgi:hypothetical protein
MRPGGFHGGGGGGGFRGGGGGGFRGGGHGGGGYHGGGHHGGGHRGGGGGGVRRRSDIRLKHDIALIGRLDNGLGFYRFAYNGEDQVYVGVMAQEVLKVMPEAVSRGHDGYFRVNYDRLGLRFQTFAEWIAAGARKSCALRPDRKSNPHTCPLESQKPRNRGSAGVKQTTAIALANAQRQ